MTERSWLLELHNNISSLTMNSGFYMMIVLDSVNNEKGNLFFVHSAGGGGKTFVCNTIAAVVRKEGKIALCVASSGIASLLMEGGRTANSRFKIPLQLTESSKCGIKRG